MKVKRKKLKIAIVSKLWEETSPNSRGGTGSSIGLLVNALVERGHHVTLFATGNSKTKAQKLVAIRQKHYQGDYSEVHEYANIAAAFKNAHQFDLIHCAVEQKSVLFADLVKTPSLHSIRYGEFFDHELDLLKEYKHLNFVAISQAIKKKFSFLNWQGVVYNGLEVNDFIQRKKVGDYLLYLARVSPQKGIDIAIQAALQSNRKLIIAGKLSTTDEKFLQKNFYPFIDNQQIEYKGEVLGLEKKKLLASAYCLLHPNRVFEACGNSILEAMASDVPVIAFPNGSIPELIVNNETGYVVKNVKEVVQAITKVQNIYRPNCSKRVRDYFSLEQMLNSYEDIYYQIIQAKT